MAEAVEFKAEVLRVIDGDSIIVKNEDGKYPIRIKYVDAPEIQQKHGKESKDFLSKLKAVNISGWAGFYISVQCAICLHGVDVVIKGRTCIGRAGEAYAGFGF